METKLKFASIMVFVIIFAFLGALLNYKDTSYWKNVDNEYDKKQELWLDAVHQNNQKELDVQKQHEQMNAKPETEYGNENNNNNSHPLDNLQAPQFTNALDAYNFACYVLKVANGVHIESSGVFGTLVGEQKLRSLTKRDNLGNVYSVSLSYSSFAKTGAELYYNGKVIQHRSTTNVSPSLQGNFEGASWTTYSLSSFEENFGKMPDDIDYVVNEKTIKEVKNWSVSESGYKFKLVLDPHTSTEYYKRAIKSNANASEYPSFSKIEITVSIDKNGYFEKIVAEENYKIKAMGISSSISGRITCNFISIHDKVTITEMSH